MPNLVKRAIAKLFYTDMRFAICLRRAVGDTERFKAGYTFCDGVVADPMLAEDGGKTYLFYEAFDDSEKAHIAYAQVNEDCTVSNAGCALKIAGHHLSYPFVFKYGGEWYMIPESNDSGCVMLYRATDFPREWKFEKEILQGRFVDTTVFEMEGEWFLLTFLFNGKNEIVEPHAYRFDPDNMQVTDRLEWQNPDGLRSRGAGPIFRRHGKYYRPVQINREHSYADGLAFCEISVTGNTYREHENSKMTIDNVKTSIPTATGLHTYSYSDKYETIDIKYSKVDILKPIKKLLRR